MLTLPPSVRIYVASPGLLLGRANWRGHGAWSKREWLAAVSLIAVGVGLSTSALLAPPARRAPAASHLPDFPDAQAALANAQVEEMGGSELDAFHARERQRDLPFQHRAPAQ